MIALFGPIDALDRTGALRDAGASGVFTFEGPHDVFTPLTMAATVGGLDVMRNVAIAFPRNPIHLAHQAVDHQLLSGGRFTLGLGTQIRTQIETRFGAESTGRWPARANWSVPCGRFSRRGARGSG